MTWGEIDEICMCSPHSPAPSPVPMGEVSRTVADAEDSGDVCRDKEQMAE